MALPPNQTGGRTPEGEKQSKHEFSLLNILASDNYAKNSTNQNEMITELAEKNDETPVSDRSNTNLKNKDFDSIENREEMQERRQTEKQIVSSRLVEQNKMRSTTTIHQSEACVHEVQLISRHDLAVERWQDAIFKVIIQNLEAKGKPANWWKLRNAIRNSSKKARKDWR